MFVVMRRLTTCNGFSLFQQQFDYYIIIVNSLISCFNCGVVRKANVLCCSNIGNNFKTMITDISLIFCFVLRPLVVCRGCNETRLHYWNIIVPFDNPQVSRVIYIQGPADPMTHMKTVAISPSFELETPFFSFSTTNNKSTVIIVNSLIFCFICIAVSNQLWCTYLVKEATMLCGSVIWQ